MGGMDLGLSDNPQSAIGRKVKRRRPEDGVWTDAVVSDYLPEKAKHVLLYGINEKGVEEWEEVNLR